MNNLKILLIDEDYVKEQSIIMQNVEDKFFRPSIIKAQNVNLQSVICEDLYEEIINQFDNYYDATLTGYTGSITGYVETRILTLVDDYIQPLVLSYTLYHSSYAFYQKYTNKGVVNQTSDSSSTSDIIMMDKQRKLWEQDGIFYTTQLLKYLNDNKDTYPEYVDCDTCDDDNSNNGRTNSVGLYLGPKI